MGFYFPDFLPLCNASAYFVELHVLLQNTHLDAFFIDLLYYPLNTSVCSFQYLFSFMPRLNQFLKVHLSFRNHSLSVRYFFLSSLNVVLHYVGTVFFPSPLPLLEIFALIFLCPHYFPLYLLLSVPTEPYTFITSVIWQASGKRLAIEPRAMSHREPKDPNDQEQYLLFQ